MAQSVSQLARWAKPVPWIVLHLVEIASRFGGSTPRWPRLETMNATTDAPRAALDARILAATTERLGISPVQVVHSTGSTNADLIDAIVRGQAAHLSSLTCEYQSAGKGRLEREWQVPEGAALTVSIAVNPDPALPIPALSWYTMLAALAWCQAIETQTDLTASVKWPNDVLLGSRKVCGILAQLASSTTGPALVVGTGMNVDQERAELPVATATSLRLASGQRISRSELLASYLSAFHGLDAAFRAVAGDAGAGLAAYGGKSLRELVAAKLATLGHWVRIEYPDGTSLEAQALNVAADGALEVQDAQGGQHRVLAGDVQHVRRSDGQYA